MPFHLHLYMLHQIALQKKKTIKRPKPRTSRKSFNPAVNCTALIEERTAPAGNSYGCAYSLVLRSLHRGLVLCDGKPLPPAYQHPSPILHITPLTPCAGLGGCRGRSPSSGRVSPSGQKTKDFPCLPSHLLHVSSLRQVSTPSNKQ